MRTDLTGEWREILAAFVISWVYHAAQTASEVQDNGGDFWTGFAYGLANPTVEAEMHYGNGETPTVGPRQGPEIDFDIRYTAPDCNT